MTTCSRRSLPSAHPKQVAADIAGRFAGQVDRVGFYTPYLISEETLGELAAEMASATR